MNNITKDFVNEAGEKETLVVSSNDNRTLNLNGYVLSNHREKKESTLTKKFKGSILGSDIGIKSEGFSTVAILATVIALAVAIVLYFIWRF